MPRRPGIEVRKSGIEGRGVYATREFKRGDRIVEYRGQRIGNDEADRRYKGRKGGRTYLFTIDDDTLIDAEVNGNDARFINHSCAPNCRSNMDGRRVYIEATRRIQPGEELAYDYRLILDGEIEQDDLETYRCLCGAPKCRGTMLWISKKRLDALRSPAPPAKNGHKRAAPAKKAAKPAPAKRRKTPATP